MRKICVVTGSRADYGLLFWLLKAIQEDAELKLQLIVTGAHLSPEFGLTWQKIQEDGFNIDYKVEMLLSADTPASICKAMGLGLIGFADALQLLKPDLVVILGDRFEVFSVAQAALVQRIPIAHIHGGELSEGATDDAMRHAITKLSHIHFTATETYRRRVIQLGEQPDAVFNVGAPGLDNIYKLSLLDRPDLENALGFKFAQRNILVTFHPVTLENASGAAQYEQLFLALDAFKDLRIIFTHSNADVEGRIIKSLIENYCKKNDWAVSFVNLGSLHYLSTMRQVDAVVGNSSSGIIEAPAFKIATVNIGDRQRGRTCANSVVHCFPNAESIQKALDLIFSPDFKQSLSQIENPYGKGGASLQIKQKLKQVNLQGLLKKRFYEIDYL